MGQVAFSGALCRRLPSELPDDTEALRAVDMAKEPLQLQLEGLFRSKQVGMKRWAFFMKYDDL